MKLAEPDQLANGDNRSLPMTLQHRIRLSAMVVLLIVGLSCQGEPDSSGSESNRMESQSERTKEPKDKES